MDIKYITVDESPDFNFCIDKGNDDRKAANRVVLCIMSEFGMMNNCKPKRYQIQEIISTVQHCVCNEKYTLKIDVNESD